MARQILVTSTNRKKLDTIKYFFPNYNVIGLTCKASHPQPFGYEGEQRQSVTCAIERINVALDTQKDLSNVVYVFSIENGIINIDGALFDVSDIAMYDCQNDKYYTTAHIPDQLLIRVPIIIDIDPGYDYRKFYTESFKSNITPGELFSEKYGWKHSIWRSDLAVDRLVQMKASMRHVLDKFRMTMSV